MNKETLLDTNAVLRYILEDLPEQTDIVEAVLKSGPVLILPEVVAEVIYVMTKTYLMSRKCTAGALVKFLHNIQCSNNRLILAVKLYGETKLDFVDCMLYAYSGEYKIFTFDKELQTMLQSKPA